ncbi:SPASM domain-containing protein [Candidatus Sumerlaeota bacterium]|nr:SPASM domain-containing protein [Candidatus Sumerlaeota bacterium]
MQNSPLHIDEKTDCRCLPDHVRHQPNHIWIEPTNRCNTRCRHCAHYYRKFGEDMPPALYEKIRTALLDHVETVELIGYGEPFIGGSFHHMFDDCQRRKIKVHCTSNGILLRKPELTSKFVRGKMQIALSIDGARKETFEFVRPLIKWEQMQEILETIKRCRDEAGDQAAGFELRFNFVAMKHNIGDLPELVRIAAKYNADCIFVLPLSDADIFPEIAGQSLHNSPELVSPAYFKAMKEAARLGVNLTVPPSFHELILTGPERGRSLQGRLARWSRKVRLFPIAVRKNGWRHALKKASNLNAPRHRDGAHVNHCGFPWNDTYFAADGTVYPCCIMNAKLGDMNDQSWDEIWNGPAYRNLRRTIHSWNPNAVCRFCGLPTGINGGYGRQYHKFFGRFQRREIPLDAPGVSFEDGFYQLERDDAGAISHCWMSRKGKLRLPAAPGARFIRLGITPLCPRNDRVNPGRCRVNGGREEPFDNSCDEIHFPVRHDADARQWTLELEMENSAVVPPDTRELALVIREIHLLF